MATIAIIFGSTMGNTESAAEQIAANLSGHETVLINVSELTADTFAEYSNIILGTSTWGCGDLQDDWEGAISTLQGANLTGKTVAVFGCGDSSAYSDTFVDGVGTLYEAAKSAGANMVGDNVSTDGYSFSDSTACVDGVFVGLPLDDDTCGDNDARMTTWCAEISPLFK
ncbi:MAG: flavodoxin [bacterium]